MLTFFYKLVALTLGYNSVENLRVTNIVKEIRFEGVGLDRSKILFPDTAIHNIFETNCSFHVK